MKKTTDANLLVDRFFWFALGAAAMNFTATLLPPIILPWAVAPVFAIALAAKLISKAAG